jgi:hypothetical protein
MEKGLIFFPKMLVHRFDISRRFAGRRYIDRSMDTVKGYPIIIEAPEQDIQGNVADRKRSPPQCAGSKRIEVLGKDDLYIVGIGDLLHNMARVAMGTVDNSGIVGQIDTGRAGNHATNAAKDK